MLLIQETPGSGVTLEAILSNLPHDAGAIVVYILMIAFVGFIWYGSRKSPAIDEGRDESRE